MELNPRLLAFLEHEMQNIMDDPDRDDEDRAHASTILGRVEGEIEWEEEQAYNGDVDATELFS
ncbi:hypothetical protein EGH21_08310 [Halomicroarcula sp. F13]|uniref:Uncharacterized protein n=1 Tax=Haloarcula rubra TaxID=2487747 RepID=A0AAW4PPK9_9EURY|nr:hypothetical protein [Halomicroarcula rubra]MBX0323027.1 hypothetical protein [Halomicroarcula rubra]